MKKMQDEQLLFAEDIATRAPKRNQFLWNLQRNPVFGNELQVIREKYLEGIERSTGHPLRPEERVERYDAFMLCAAYLFAGLYSLSREKIPDIPLTIIEEMRRNCDDGDVRLEWHNFLCSPGETNEIWAANLVKLVSAQGLNAQGSGLLYALAMAWIKAEESAEAQAGFTQDVQMRTAAMREKSPGLWGDLDEILEASGFGEEPQERDS